MKYHLFIGNYDDDAGAGMDAYAGYMELESASQLMRQHSTQWAELATVQEDGSLRQFASYHFRYEVISPTERYFVGAWFLDDHTPIEMFRIHEVYRPPERYTAGGVTGYLNEQGQFVANPLYAAPSASETTRSGWVEDPL